MIHQEEDQYAIQERIQQGDSSDLPKKVAIGVIGVTVLLALPAILELASGQKPWRF